METIAFLIYFRITTICNGVDWGYITLLWCLPFRCCITHDSTQKLLLFLSIIILLFAQSLQLTFNTFEGWVGPTPFINYVDFWTIKGFLRNLFFNGYHPIFPWFSFFLIGMLIGRLDLHNKNKKITLTRYYNHNIDRTFIKRTYTLFIPYIGRDRHIFI